MKFIVLALLCVVAYAAAQAEPEAIEEYQGSPRFRRDDSKGSVVVTATKPIGGPDRRPSLDIDYKQHIHEKNGWRTDAYGGMNIRSGQSAQPHGGLTFDRDFKNGHIGGFGGAQRFPGGRISPTFGVQGGFRFRRDVNDVESEEMGY
ncbi:hypothetical protein E2986_03150 [Frieseomelitta varia]|uniref:Hymenoptaecin n=1 Tax=Frieseomelitta varia TaxID=561572 RepID=A0A833RU22_9HYME|nr:hymenoptaecin-like [Frieseomelitta varia]KAF3428348.1 hypothetical protein E2986_03150 [Frieseomelitta varia]